MRNLADLLQDMERRNGPVPPDVAEKVDREWREALQRMEQ
jgi:hypothetical protein